MSIFDEKNDIKITKEILSGYGFVECFGMNKFTIFKDSMTKYICPKPFSLVNARIYYDFEATGNNIVVDYHSRGDESFIFYRVDDVFGLEIVINEVYKQVKAKYDYIYREDWNWKDIKLFTA